MSETADHIREAREQKGLTLAQVEEATRIPRYYLEILEGTGDERLISDRLYMVHFLRSYAAFLELDVEPLEVEFLRESRRMTAAQQLPEEESRSRKPVFFALAAVVLAGAGVGAYLHGPTLLDFRQAGVEEEAPPSIPSELAVTQPLLAPDTPGADDDTADSVLQPEANETNPAEPRLVAAPPREPEPEPAAPVQEPPAPTQDASASTDATDAPTTTPEETAASSADEPQPAAADGDGEATDPPEAAPAPIAAASGTPAAADSPGAQSLTIEAHEKSWLRVRADDEKSRDMLLDPGQVATLSARTGFVITFGNAGGVRLRFNGEELPPVGKSGQVVRNFELPPPE